MSFRERYKKKQGFNTLFTGHLYIGVLKYINGYEKDIPSW